MQAQDNMGTCLAESGKPMFTLGEESFQRDSVQERGFDLMPDGTPLNPKHLV